MWRNENDIPQIGTAFAGIPYIVSTQNGSAPSTVLPRAPDVVFRCRRDVKQSDGGPISKVETRERRTTYPEMM